MVAPMVFGYDWHMSIDINKWLNERRFELIAQLNRKVPIIARECRSNPVSKYVRYLPQGIRKLL